MINKKSIRRWLITMTLITVSAMGVLMVWYKYTYSMDKIESAKINTPDKPYKILIASQGSAFKNELTQRLIERLSSDDRYLHVVDVTELDQSYEGYNAYVIIHTWEINKPPKGITELIGRKDRSDLIFSVGTSGNGQLSLDNVDGITSASEMEDIDAIVKQVIDWVNQKLLI